MRCHCITSITSSTVDIPDTERSLPTGTCWPLVGEIILTVCNFVLRDDVGGVDGDDGDGGACCVAVGGFLGCRTVFGIPC